MLLKEYTEGLSGVKRKRRREGKFAELEEAVHIWLIEKNQGGIPPSSFFNKIC